MGLTQWVQETWQNSSFFKSLYIQIKCSLTFLQFLCIPTYNHAIILPLTGWLVIRQAHMSMKRNSTHCGLSAGRRGISDEACLELDNGSSDPRTERWLSWRLEQAPRGPSTVLVGAEWSPGEKEPHRTPHMRLFHTCFLSPITEHKRGDTQNTWQLMSSLKLFTLTVQWNNISDRPPRKQHKIKSTLIGRFFKYLGLS